MPALPHAHQSPAVGASLAAPGGATPGGPFTVDDLDAARRLGTDVPATIAWVADVAPRLPLPGSGHTADLWSALAAVAAVDVGVARTLEPHLDALAILAQAPGPVGLDVVDAGEAATWGVFAAEGPGARLEAISTDGDWSLTGTKPWCSLAADLSHALVTAWTDAGRRLFAVDLRPSSVVPAEGPWVARGLAQVVSASVRFDAAPAVPVGAAGWYLERPGFAWGGIGVAACWWGGAVGLARTLWDALGRREPDQLALAHLGTVDAALCAARAVLAEAADAVDAGRDGAVAALVARRARSVVADAVEEVQRRCAHALGPGPLSTDEEFARRVADLGLYVRQHHAERDQAALGRDLLAAGERPW
ncbi:acyl-CoA/acyl-ACP dehydrogenase [Cellulosimicrobium arenosum]|uniref:Acyl-CoA/acyl-ACP dehydrogenase n=1 Tax=Cellulosimicrobium arenosum TaxID=2708133 RepID=A0A927IZD6_9MICO|nr:acyl-CoA/acyl-ACP dehydrogenase [Cellulosimicrobium arenosum]MBD8078415.1 acyl-CoA/acyl-ACP dehydrogenase [Cellulosimicrobium arenosum]